MVVAEQCEHCGRYVRLASQCVDSLRLLNHSARKYQRQAIAPELVVVYVFRVCTQMVRHDYDERILPHLARLQGCDKSAQTAVSIVESIQFRLLQSTMSRHIKRLMAASGQCDAEERLLRSSRIGSHTLQHRSVSHAPFARSEFSFEVLFCYNSAEASGHKI